MSDKVRQKTKRIIVWFVIWAHVILLVIPGLVYALTEWLKPEKTVVHKVVLADSPPAGNPTPGGSQGDPPPQTDDPLPDPGEISEIPDMPQPKPTPEPTPKPKPVVKPKPTPKPKPKPVVKPKPTPKPKPKPVVKPKPTPKPKRLTADQIRSKIQRSPQKRPVRQTQRQPRNININPNPDRNVYSDIAKDIRAGNTSGGGGSGRSYNYGAVSSYYGTVGNFLERLWERDRPNSSALGGRHPVVVVRFRVAPNGTIMMKRIERKCGIASVDASVERLLARIKALPQPPQGVSEFTVNMRVEE